MSLHIVSNNGLPPDDPTELIKESQNYEYSTSVPLNIWLNASSRMIKHGHSFASQGLIGDAYVLYLKFIDLFVTKLYKHPDLINYKNNFKRSGILTKDGKSYKQYLELKKNLIPLMEECEKFNKILNDNYNNYLKLTNDQQNEYNNGKLISNRDKRYSNSSVISSNSSVGGSVTSGGKRRKSVVRGSFSDNSSGANKYSNSNSNSNYVNDIKLLKQIRSLSMNSDSSYNNGSAISNIDELPSYPDTFNLSSLHSSLSDLSTLTSLNNIKPPALPEKISLSSSTVSSMPPPPPPPYTPHNDIVHKTVNFTEGGIPLKTVFIPRNIQDDFLKIAKSNTKKKLETCGVLCGKLSRNAFFITDLIIPEQESTANTCNTKNEEKMFDVVDKLDLFVLGWIHTHPTQSCFLSSIDLHTQNSYQIMLNEAVALVCSPSPQFENHNFGCFRLTDPPGKPLITSCSLRGFHPHEEKNLYVTCNRLNGENSTGHVVFHDGLPFKIHDLR